MLTVKQIIGSLKLKQQIESRRIATMPQSKEIARLRARVAELERDNAELLDTLELSDLDGALMHKLSKRKP